MEEKQHQLVHQAKDVFMRYGIKSVTMDDIARHLGISKKTLYKYVSDKNDLIRQILSISCDMEEEVVKNIMGRKLNAIDESFEISHFVVNQLKQVHPSIHYDLEKYHSETWREFKSRNSGNIYNCMTANMEHGIEEGYYRDDLNIPVVAKIYISRFDAVFDGELFPVTQYQFSEVYLEMFRYHIRGIASEKGIQYLVEKVKKEKQKL